MAGLGCWKTLSKLFYERDPELVAKDLLGKRLVRRLCKEILEGLIVETEAYYGMEDPASRAYHGMKRYNAPMWGEVGLTFIYNVHNNWMFNVVAHRRGEVGAVLIRAVEPTRGLDAMKQNRKAKTVFELTNGPGKLTKAFKIDKKLNGLPVYSTESEVFISDNETRFKVGSSHRIGVKRDLEKKLRFFIEGNRFVSKHPTRGSCRTL